MEDRTEAIHRQLYRLHSYEVDLRGRAKPDILLSFMLDSAWSHTKDTEFSYSELKEEGQLWVLSRFLAVFHDMPKWGDEVSIETWGKGIEKLFGLRDFIIHSHDGKKLVSATSAWLIIERQTQRVQRIDALGKNFPMQLERHELDIKLEKIDAQESERTDFNYIVRYSDLDVNKHVNSSKYIQWIFDSFPVEFHGTKSLKSFEVNFLSEARLGDHVLVMSAQSGDCFYCEVKRESDAVELCRARLRWT